MLKDLWSGKVSRAVAERQEAFARVLGEDGAPVSVPTPAKAGSDRPSDHEPVDASGAEALAQGF